MEGGRVDGLMREVIRRGALAGALRQLARECPEAERGLMKQAAKYSSDVERLLGELALTGGL